MMQIWAFADLGAERMVPMHYGTFRSQRSQWINLCRD